MMLSWIGLALLSASWLLGPGYYHPPHWPAWTVIVLLGTVLLASRPVRLPDRRQLAVAAAMLLPAVWFMPWPYRAAPLLMAVGLALQLAPRPPRWPHPLGWGAVKAGVVLLGQSLALLAYTSQTARCHDLPRPLARLLGWIASALGIDAAVHGNTITMHSLLEVHDDAAIHYMPASWELFLDPATLSFFVGGLILLGATRSKGVGSLYACFMLDREPTQFKTPDPFTAPRWSKWIRAARVFALVTVAWLPVRCALLVALFLDRVLRANPALRPTAMNQFFSPWLSLLLLAGPVLLAWWFVRKEGRGDRGEGRDLPAEGFVYYASNPSPLASHLSTLRWQYPAALALVFGAVAIVSFLVEWQPVGRRKQGRVLVVERHSTWEPTDRPYDTNHFGHDPSYSYTRLYDYCSQFYEMSRLEELEKIDAERLSGCDVLVIKIPTERYSPEEIKAVVRFVRSGGGLLHDVLFQIGSPYIELHRWPAVPHPIVQHLPPTHFAGSCSVDPGSSWGRAAVTGTGLWSLPPNYHAEDTFFPEAEYHAVMNYGAFIELWATCHGDGRVLAFGDSTIFSNFSIFEPGKADFMVGMLEWLNHSSPMDHLSIRLLVAVPALLAALASLAFGLLLARAGSVAWPVLVAAGVLGFTVASLAVVTVHARSMPMPQAVRPMVRVMVDRTVSQVPLSLGGFTEPDGRGYGLLEQWIPRLGYSTKRSSGREAFSGDALVVICPTGSVTREFREGLAEYVAGGGKVLVIDSPDHPFGGTSAMPHRWEGSTANSLLWPFKMAVNHAVDQQGELRLTDDWPPGIKLQATCEVVGGEPFMWVGQLPVGARVDYGKGSVMAIGFGSLFNDDGMGMFWTQEPDAELLNRFDVLFALVEALVEDHPVVAPPARIHPAR